MEIKNCQFTGVKWEGKALDAVNDIAKALLNLTTVLCGMEVKIDTLLKIEQPKTIQEKKRGN